MYYSLFEKHKGGWWWYHKKAFRDPHRARYVCDHWIWWDKTRKKKIFRTDFPLPKITLHTKDFKEFYNNDQKLIIKLQSNVLKRIYQKTIQYGRNLIKRGIHQNILRGMSCLLSSFSFQY